MAAFASVTAAHTRAQTKMADRTWINAHGAVTPSGTPCVRVQRPMTAAFAANGGSWVEITDDGTT